MHPRLATLAAWAAYLSSAANARGSWPRRPRRAADEACPSAPPTAPPALTAARSGGRPASDAKQGSAATSSSRATGTAWSAAAWPRRRWRGGSAMGSRCPLARWWSARRSALGPGRVAAPRRNRARAGGRRWAGCSGELQLDGRPVMADLTFTQELAKVGIQALAVALAGGLSVVVGWRLLRSQERTSARRSSRLGFGNCEQMHSSRRSRRLASTRTCERAASSISKTSPSPMRPIRCA